MSLKIRPPTKEELAFIQKAIVQEARVCVRQRFKIILAKLKGAKSIDIAKRLACSPNTVYKWLHLWNDEGIGAIVTWRHYTTSQHQVKRRTMLAHLSQHTPEQLQLEFTSWSLRTIRSFLRDPLICDISVTTLWRDLRLINARYRTTQKKLLVKPVDYALKKAYLTILQRFSPPTTRVVYLDEKGPVHAVRYSGSCWSIWPITFDVRQVSQGRVPFLGGYDPRDYQLEMFPMEDLTSYSFRQALGLIKATFLTKRYNRLLLVMDNAPWHKAKATLDYLATDPQLDYFFLPAYSPELNPIERCFGSYQRECLNNGSFTSRDELIERTYSYCHYFNTLRREIYA